MEWFLNWLKQPSTLRVVNLIAAFFAYRIAPELWEQIITICGMIYVLIDGLYNKQPNKP